MTRQLRTFNVSTGETVARPFTQAEEVERDDLEAGLAVKLVAEDARLARVAAGHDRLANDTITFPELKELLREERSL